eukprot:363264-Chlamydomonas_euryale.AAC.2
MEEQEDVPDVQQEHTDRVGAWVQQASPAPRRTVAQSWAARSWKESSASSRAAPLLDRCPHALGQSRGQSRFVAAPRRWLKLHTIHTVDLT